MGTFTLTGLLFSFMIGVISDSIKQKYLLLIGVILFFIFCFGLTKTTTFGFLLALFAFGGLANVIIVRTTETLVLKSTDRKNKGKKLSIYHVFRTLPFVIGIVIGGYLIQTQGFIFLFKISAILCAGVLIPVLWIKDTKLFHSPIVSYFKDLKRRKVFYFCLTIFIFGLHFGAEQTAYSPFLKINLGLDIIHSAYYMGAVVIFLLISTLVTGKLIDKGVSGVKILSYSMLLSGVGSVLSAITTYVPFSIIGRMIHDIGDGAFILSISTGVVSLFDKERMGGNAGFIHMITIISTVVGALIFGPIGFSYGYHIPHIISGLLSIIAFVMIWIFRR